MTAQILTQKELKQILHYDPDTGVFVWLFRRGCKPKGSVAGHTQNNGYVMTRINQRPFLLHRLAFLYMTGSMPNGQVDHINHITDDNRWINLRDVSGAENSRNSSMRSNNTSGYVGVYWDSKRRKWFAAFARIVNDKRKFIRLGFFSQKADAIAARAKGNIEYGFHKNHGAQGFRLTNPDLRGLPEAEY